MAGNKAMDHGLDQQWNYPAMTETAKRTAWEFIVALSLALLLITPWMVLNLIEDVSRLKVQQSEPEDYFIVASIVVGNAREGSQPQIIYDRTIVRPFRAVWTAAVFALPERDGVNYGVCNNSSTADYETDTRLPGSVSLEWFIEKDCNLQPGRYVLKTTWEIRLDYNIRKYVRATSNVFEILPAN